MGLPVAAFASAEEFLAAYAGQSGCLVTDVRLLGMSGLDLQDEMRRREIGLPVIVITGHPRTPLVVRAIQSGAVTMLEKPYADDDLWVAIRKAIDLQRRQRPEEVVEPGDLERFLSREPAPEMAAEMEEQYRRLLERLADAELQRIALWKVEGLTNVEIAQKLGCVVRSVERKLKRIRILWEEDLPE